MGKEYMRKQITNGLTFVKPEGCDGYQTHNIRYVHTDGGDDLSAIGVTGRDGRSILESQHMV